MSANYVLGPVSTDLLNFTSIIKKKKRFLQISEAYVYHFTIFFSSNCSSVQVTAEKSALRHGNKLHFKIYYNKKFHVSSLLYSCSSSSSVWIPSARRDSSVKGRISWCTF